MGEKYKISMTDSWSDYQYKAYNLPYMTKTKVRQYFAEVRGDPYERVHNEYKRLLRDKFLRSQM